MERGFDTTRSGGKSGDQGSSLGFLGRYKPQIVISFLVVLVLMGGAFYAARGSENAPKVVYSASLEEVAAEANQPLLININTADVEELDELPEVGPSTAQEIVDHRQANGLFRTVDELEEVSGIGPKTIEEIKPFAEI
ncbi:MAG: helix-hairpin-helix domain-containing protein [Rubrobacteraceae bacterium]